MVLNSRASQEMVSVPPGRHALGQVAAGDLPGGGFEALQPAQHGHPDDHPDGAHQQQGDGRGAAHQPAQVVRHLCAQLIGLVIQDQDAVDLVRGSWQREAFRPVADGDHGAQHFAAAGLDHAAGSALRGGIAVAGLAGGRVDLQIGVRRAVPGRDSAPRRCGRAPPAAPPATARGSCRSSWRSGCGRSRSSGVPAPRGSGRPRQSAVERAVSSRDCMWCCEYRIGAAGTREHDGRCDSHGKTDGRAGERRL